MHPLSLCLFLFAMSTGPVELSEAEKEWVYLANIMREQTGEINDPSEKLKSMTDWLHLNVKHVSRGKYPRTFNRKSIATIIQSGVGNCGYQSFNIIGFAQMLGYPNHRILHHRKNKGAPGDHTFAEIEVDGHWIIYDPDKFQYFMDETGELLGVEEVAGDSSSWVGVSAKSNGFIETKSSKPCPRTAFDYYCFEKQGMSYIRVLTKMRKIEDVMIAENKLH